MITAYGSKIFENQESNLPKAQLRVNDELKSITGKDYYRLMQTGRMFLIGAQTIEKLNVRGATIEKLGKFNVFEFTQFYIDNKYTTIESQETLSSKNSLLSFQHTLSIQSYFMNYFPQNQETPNMKEVLENAYLISKNHYGQLTPLTFMDQMYPYYFYGLKKCPKGPKFEEDLPRIEDSIINQYEDILIKIKKSKEQVIPLLIPVFQSFQKLNDTLQSLEKVQDIQETIIIVSYDEQSQPNSDIINSFINRRQLNIIHINHPSPEIPRQFLRGKESER